MLYYPKAAWFIGSLALILSSPLSHAIILYSGDNSANLVAPDTARADVFDAVAKVCNSTGGGTSGSAIHLQGKYMLTANHVSNRTHVTFDGSSFFIRDTTFTPVKIGNTDMKLFKLLEDPGLPDKSLYTDANGDVGSTATLIGWGRGRNPNVSDPDSTRTNIWAWGSSSTELKRWGTNKIETSLNQTGPFGNYYEVLVTTLNPYAGDDEASAAIYDSGSGLFVQDSGTWKLAGLTTYISSPTTPQGTSLNTSTFHRLSNSRDINYFVRISTYASQIEAAIPDISTYSGWKIDHGLYGNEAENESDTDSDGVEQLLEFALGGDPNTNDVSILPSLALVEHGGSTYLELTLTRPVGLQGITYTAQTTTNLSNWPSDSIGIDDPSPTPQDNADGTETLIYRRSLAQSEAAEAYMRINITVSP